MRAILHGRTARVIWILLTALCLGGCESGPLGEQEQLETDTAAIYAAAANYLATEANGYGPGHRFSELHVVERTTAGTARVDGRPSTGTALNKRERTAIGASLATLSPVRFIESRTEWLDADYNPVVSGAAILTLAPILWDENGGAAVGASLWCGAGCAVWTVINVELGADGWRAVGDVARTIS